MNKFIFPDISNRNLIDQWKFLILEAERKFHFNGLSNYRAHVFFPLYGREILPDESRSCLAWEGAFIFYGPNFKCELSAASWSTPQQMLIELIKELFDKLMNMKNQFDSEQDKFKAQLILANSEQDKADTKCIISLKDWIES